MSAEAPIAGGLQVLVVGAGRGSRGASALAFAPAQLADIDERDLRPWALTDLHGDSARLSAGARELMMVVRPDGHIRLALPRIDRSLLVRYLRLLCPPLLVDEVVLGGVQ